MTSSIKMQKLDCYQVAKAIAVRVHEARIGDAELRDQATRAAKEHLPPARRGAPERRRRHATKSTSSPRTTASTR